MHTRMPRPGASMYLKACACAAIQLIFENFGSFDLSTTMLAISDEDFGLKRFWRLPTMLHALPRALLSSWYLGHDRSGRLFPEKFTTVSLVHVTQILSALGACLNSRDSPTSHHPTCVRHIVHDFTERFVDVCQMAAD